MQVSLSFEDISDKSQAGLETKTKNAYTNVENKGLIPLLVILHFGFREPFIALQRRSPVAAGLTNLDECFKSEHIRGLVSTWQVDFVNKRLEQFVPRSSSRLPLIQRFLWHNLPFDSAVHEGPGRRMCHGVDNLLRHFSKRARIPKIAACMFDNHCAFHP